ELDSCMAVDSKPILVLLSTDWCKYCQMQKNQLLKNKDFQNAGNLFYYVLFDAESKEKVHLHGQNYSFRPTGVSTGVHELAIDLNGSEKLAFPTEVLLNKNYQVLFRNKSVLEPKQLAGLLRTMQELSKKQQNEIGETN